MKISGSGIANNGISALKRTKEYLNNFKDEGEEFNIDATDWMSRNVIDFSMPESAISCLHDALLAVAKGMITKEEVIDFFWEDDLDEAKFIGGVLKFTDKEKNRG